MDNYYSYYYVVFMLCDDVERVTPSIEANPFVKGTLCDDFLINTAINCIKLYIENTKWVQIEEPIINKVNHLKFYVSNDKELNDVKLIKEMDKKYLIKLTQSTKTQDQIIVNE